MFSGRLSGEVVEDGLAAVEHGDGAFCEEGEGPKSYLVISL